MDDRRSGEDRRGRGRPKGGRRSSDPINSLETHPSPLVTIAQLAEYWGKHAYTLTAYVRRGKLRALRVGGEYRVTLEAAREFEKGDGDWRKRSA